MLRELLACILLLNVCVICLFFCSGKGQRGKGKGRHYLTEEEVRAKEERERREMEWKVRLSPGCMQQHVVKLGLSLTWGVWQVLVG